MIPTLCDGGVGHEIARTAGFYLIGALILLVVAATFNRKPNRK